MARFPFGAYPIRLIWWSIVKEYRCPTPALRKPSVFRRSKLKLEPAPKSRGTKLSNGKRALAIARDTNAMLKEPQWLRCHCLDSGRTSRKNYSGLLGRSTFGLGLLGPPICWAQPQFGSQVPPGFGYGRASDCRFFRLGHPWYYLSTAGGGPLIGLQIHPGPGHTRYIRYTGGPMPGSRVYQGPGYSTKPGTPGAQVYP